MTYIYLYHSPMPLSEADLSAIIRTLPQFRREKLGALSLPEDKTACAVTYAMLRAALSVHFGMEGSPEFVFGENGKPYLRDFPEAFFSLSHCKNAFACGVSVREIGIDVQDIRHIGEAVIKRVCTEEESGFISNSPEPEREFARLWTKKESFIKSYGGKLSDSFGIDVNAREGFAVYDYPSFVLSAYKATADKTKVFEVTLSEIIGYSKLTFH